MDSVFQAITKCQIFLLNVTAVQHSMDLTVLDFSSFYFSEIDRLLGVIKCSGTAKEIKMNLKPDTRTHTRSIHLLHTI